MKKILLIALIGTLFAATAAFACDTCAKHTKGADGSKMVCPADCDKPCCAEKKKCCGECEKCTAEKAKCCGEDGKCCHEGHGHKHGEKAACCGEGGECCKEKKAETATKTEAVAPCCSAMLGKPA